MDGQRLIFTIDAYTPETIPMAKLAEYMTDLALLLGRENAVHFAGVEKGSTKIAALVEFEDIPKVKGRLTDVGRGNAPKDVTKIFEQIDTRLANDNAVGRISEEGEEGFPVEILVFPGRNRPKRQSYGPFTQEGHLDGILISVGGKDETISVRLQNGDKIYTKCETTRGVARELAKHLFEPVRIYGNGRWLREASGEWTLLSFKVYRFEALGKETLRESVQALRAIPGSAWGQFADPMKELEAVRHEDELH